MIDQTDNVAGTSSEPGAAMRLVAQKLAAQGFELREPDWEDGRILRVTGLGDTSCDITVEDHGFVTWDYYPRGRNAADPGKIVARVMRLLADHRPGSAGGQQGRDAVGEVRELIGHGLETAGLAVSLEVYGDSVSYQVLAELAVTNPARPERGRVTLGDDGGLMWECGFEEDATSPADIASVIAAVLVGDIADGSVVCGQPSVRVFSTGRDR